MSTKRITLPLFLILALPSTTRLLGQPLSPTSSRASENRATNENARTLFVSVLDKNGAPVANIKREDFSVREKGTPQEVLAVSGAASVPLLLGVLIASSGHAGLGNQRTEKLEAISKSLPELIGKSGEAFIISFADDVHLVTGITSDRNALQTRIRTIEEEPPHGSATLYDSMIFAARLMQPETERRKIILLLSDFRDANSANSLEQAVACLQETGTTLILLQDILHWPHELKEQEKGQKLGREAAEKTGGVAYPIDSGDTLASALKRIRALLEDSYVLKYKSGAARDQIKSAQLKIKVSDKTFKVLAPTKAPSPSITP